MKVKLRWFVTGNLSVIDEADDILNAHTTVLELKGLIQGRFGFPPKELALIQKHLLDNHITMGELGITSSDSDVVLTTHVIRAQAKLEKRNSIAGDIAPAVEEEEGDDDDLQEFTHDDYILAMRMLGRDVPVTGDRLKQVRENAPRSRPTFVPSAAAPPPPPPSDAPDNTVAPAEEYHPRNTEVHRIFRDMRHGMRMENVDKTFQLEYPGVEEPFSYWDIEVKAGVRARLPLPIREAGCMYPLVAVPVIMTEMEGNILGGLLFEEFGTATGLSHSSHKEDAGAVAGKPSACGQQ
ncbi:Hypothetical protein, putative [Bodo saltans]|uniref:Ubiquitin-like domain-containing protein n=1 Tax=Bodo saltans TaxID=75058 RepID=A0A0S4JUQ7_BODSA|nr:Hypothetical protein, putative [Bodo saltans]|eukprot:CUG94311.1 Hypothetical protein, putative [Bodo saltans]